MRIFITGGSGFLGSALCRFLTAQGHSIVSPGSGECNLRQQDSLVPYSSQKFDLLFHLAAWTQAGDFCIKHPGEQWIVNQEINTNVLKWWASAQPKAKLVFMGTSCVYSPSSSLREYEYMLGEPIESLYTYAMTKRMLYQGARALNSQFGLSYLCIVPSTLYGPGYHTDGRQMHFIFDLIRKILRGKELGEDVVLWGDGHQKRELVYIDDFVRVLWKLSNSHKNEIFNIGAGLEFSIREFAELICKQIGYPSNKIKYDTSRYVGAKSKCLNVEKLRNSLGPFETKPLEDGLRETINWFYQNKQTWNQK